MAAPVGKPLLYYLSMKASSMSGVVAKLPSNCLELHMTKTSIKNYSSCGQLLFQKRPRGPLHSLRNGNVNVTEWLFVREI